MIGANPIYPTIETCEKLRKLGFPQDPEQTHFGWIYYEFEDHLHEDGKYLISPWWECTSDLADDNPCPEMAAPTLQEMWAHLPQHLNVKVTDRDGYELTVMVFREISGECDVSYLGEYSSVESKIRGTHLLYRADCENLAEAAALVWIWLKENNHIK